MQQVKIASLAATGLLAQVAAALKIPGIEMVVSGPSNLELWKSETLTWPFLRHEDVVRQHELHT